MIKKELRIVLQADTEKKMTEAIKAIVKWIDKFYKHLGLSSHAVFITRDK